MKIPRKILKKTVNPTLFICVVDKTALKTEKIEKKRKTNDFHM
jgi:hypothetical protein